MGVGAAQKLHDETVLRCDIIGVKRLSGKECLCVFLDHRHAYISILRFHGLRLLLPV